MARIAHWIAVAGCVVASGCASTSLFDAQTSYLAVEQQGQTCYLRTFSGQISDTVCQRGDVLRYSSQPSITATTAYQIDAEAVPGYVRGLFNAMSRPDIRGRIQPPTRAPIEYETYRSPKSI